MAFATHCATRLLLCFHYFVRHILFIYHIRDFRHIGDYLCVLRPFFRLFIGWSGVMVSFAGYLRLKAADAAFLFGSALSFV